MGSEKFPEENEYDQYLQQHGGFCNAFTDAETTTYYFDVQGDFLRGALERFSGFFTKPLCLEVRAASVYSAIPGLVWRATAESYRGRAMGAS